MKQLLILVFVFTTSLSIAQQQDSTISNTVSQIDTSVYVKVDKEAQFPGGEKKWNNFVLKAIQNRINELVTDKSSAGTCEVQFIVDKEGSITNVEAINMKNSILAKIMVRSIEKGPKWEPAFVNGVPVKAIRRQKVTFRLPE
jgi:periplasmic protein TonB